MAGKFKRGRFLRALLAVSLTVVMVTGQFPLSAFADALQVGATDETTVQTENNATPVEGQEPTTGAVETPAEEQQSATDEAKAPAEEQQPATEEVAGEATEEGVIADDAAADEATNKEQAVAADEEQPEVAADQAQPRSIKSIQAITANANMALPEEQWNQNPTDNARVTINDSIEGIKSQTGVAFADLVAAKDKTTITGWNQGKTYKYWRAVLLGKDQWREGWQQKTTNYGPDGKTQPWSGNTYYADSGTTVTKVRYQDNQLQFMPAEGEDNAGNWVSIKGDGSGLQLVWYYLQVNPLKEYVNLEYSHWGMTNCIPGTGNGQTPKAAMGQVVDADTGEVLANGTPTYWYGNHAGITNVFVSEQNLGDYEIVKAAKYEAKDQDPDSWDNTDQYGKNNNDYLGKQIGSDYSASELLSKGMNTNWAGGDKNHIIFRIYVRKTAQASLVKQLAGNDTSKYQNESFTFSATVTLPESSDSTLRDSYPIDGAADGSTKVSMVVSADGKSGTVTGIQANPGKKVTLKGLPYDAAVKFTETGVPEKDPSVFTTTYVNDKTDATDGTATAKHKDGVNPNEPQTVTATNTVNPGSGKLTVTKTFKGLSNLTAQERENLYNAFQITSTENRIPALTLKNATSSTGNILADNVTKDITYTWDMAKLAEGKVTLTEQNYTVGSAGVTTESKVSADGSAFKPSAETDVTTETQAVAFTNEYGTKNEDVTIRKEWASDITSGEKKDVKVQLNWTGTVDGAKSTTGEYTLNEENNWTTTVKNLPTHTGTYGDITYSIVETKVGGQTPEKAGFKATTSTGNDGALVVTNSKATGTFELTKKVAGTAANDQQDYTFTITPAGQSLSNQSFKGMKAGKEFTLDFDKNGVATVTLKHGQTLSVQLPVGEYQVKETGVDVGTTVSAKVGDASVTVETTESAKKKFDATLKTRANVTADKTVSVVVTNTTDHKPNLGISSNSLPMAGIGAAAIVGIAALAVSQRKRNTPLGSHARKE